MGNGMPTVKGEGVASQQVTILLDGDSISVNGWYQPFSGDNCANRDITVQYDEATHTITASNGYGALTVNGSLYVSGIQGEMIT